jgi:hypothetical protein
MRGFNYISRISNMIVRDDKKSIFVSVQTNNCELYKIEFKGNLEKFGKNRPFLDPIRISLIISFAINMLDLTQEYLDAFDGDEKLTESSMKKEILKAQNNFIPSYIDDISIVKI